MRLMTMLATAAIEAMHADTFFGKTYRLDEVLDSIEPQRGDAQSMCYLVDHAEIFGRVGGGIFLEVLLGVALEILYHPSCDEFQVALRTGEVDERAAIDQRWA